MSLNQYIDSKPGIVTAANDFFIINEQQANKYALDAFTRPIVQKSSFIGNSVQFSKRDYEKLKKLGKPSLFFRNIGGISNNQIIVIIV